MNTLTERLTAAVENIPQKGPMRLIDTLDHAENDSAIASTKIKEDMIFLRENGIMDDVAYAEMISQAIAAFNCFKGVEQPDAGEWLLVGIENLEVKKSACIGDTLKISVKKQTELGSFSVIEGVVKRKEELLAKGKLKLFCSA
jgi:predicted hotdog family 3-hydroxylacyl-ACP dehydratase